MERTFRSITDLFLDDLNRLGLFYRHFLRQKEQSSCQKKILSKGYRNSGRKIQDYLGIRIVLYFRDDIKLIRSCAQRRFTIVEEVRDMPDPDSFKPMRYNLVCKIPDHYVPEFHHLISDRDVLPFIDSTFELQIRTVLSEGWHEIEHDIRYKREDDWNNRQSESRLLNGILATLELCDSTLHSLLESVSYQHYTERNWEAMFNTKLRIRLVDSSLPSPLRDLLHTEVHLAKDLFRTDRSELLISLLNMRGSLPLTLENIVFAMNRISPSKSDEITKLESPTIATLLNRL